MDENNTIQLLEVKRLVDRGMFYEIIGKDWKLPATNRHAFVVVKNGEAVPTITCNLRPDDKIYVDVYAFLADGSFTRKMK